MSDPNDLLTRCTCCTGRGQVVPLDLSQRAGLSALAYRIGTHGQFKESMLAALAGDIPLGELGTRRDDDLTIALLDSWATVLDVLTFYQERIANENYLRTALAERSLHELARLVGYQPRPGVAAEVPLAFTLDDGPNAPQAVRLPVGTRAQSVPVESELPQSFELSTELLARPEWNRLTPRLTQPQTLSDTTFEVWIEGGSAGLSTGDMMLLVVDGDPYPRELSAIEAKPAQGRTRLTLAEPWVARQQQGQQVFGGPLGIANPRLASSAGPAGLGAASSGAPRPDALRQVVDATGPTDRARQQMIAGVKRGRFDRRQLREALISRRRDPTPPPAPHRPVGATARAGTPAALDARISQSVPAARAGSPRAAAQSGETALYTLDVKTAPFGHNAPIYRTIPDEWRYSYGPYPVSPSTGVGSNWDFGIGIAETVYLGRKALSEIRLAQSFPEICPGSWVVLRDTEDVEPYRVEETSEKSVVDFALSGRATRLKLLDPLGGEADYSHLNSNFRVRDTTIYAASRSLPLAEEPIATVDAGATQLELEEIVFDLTPGRTLILRGERLDLPGVIEHEELILDDVLTPGSYSQILFSPPLGHAYRRDSVVIYANVATATHGASHREVLGSGDASSAFQRFELRQMPLTHVSAPVPSGAESTLELRVGGVKWQEAPGFYSLGPDDRSYVLDRDQDGTTRVLFGDGQRGARLPTGTENVTAGYRVGVGSEGLVSASAISLLATRHLGVREVVNPLPSRGAEDPEGRDQIRRHAPLTVLTFERVVSLQDFEDFARAFSGVGKARASWVWDGSRRIVHLTVAGADGGPLATTVRENLVKALDEASAPFQRVRVDDHELLMFGITATVRVAPGRRAQDVLPAVEAALTEAFSFEARDFAERVAVSDVLATIQGTEGVAAANLAPLHYSGPDGGNESDEIGLPARPARFENGTIQPAQLLLLMTEDIQLVEA